MRELVVLGTASQVPTRHRNHNGYLLRWDGEGLLFDPGEGTQRQMLLAGVPATAVTRLCVTHFHGDHCLGLPGMVQRLSLDRVPHPVSAHFPASGAHFFARMRHASAFHDTVTILERPAEGEATSWEGEGFELRAVRLSHSLESYGYRLREPDGRRMLPERLAALGIAGPAVGELLREGWARGADGRVVRLEDASERRPGQRFAFIMDTRLCDAAFALADGADLAVIESTFLERDALLAEQHGHLTARQAGRIARESGVRTLVLSHFSQRYADPAEFAEEAGAEFSGELVVAEDLTRVPVPRRRP
ncbi:ribonuclease Z [Allostreptomyces psammosilenae]|uniref:Ribonuclease Z n=1 Tax=Allostreptomyces psammosilenae TaxID=1892865 RepID=A0A852ZXC9_9ACTN|nr:ribonuclease Z [Allostreptomyces psammosilenae]NYI06675.1 ribonuclease Z [Allostreptomyces psammosilenae]